MIFVLMILMIVVCKHVWVIGCFGLFFVICRLVFRTMNMYFIWIVCDRDIQMFEDVVAMFTFCILVFSTIYKYFIWIISNYAIWMLEDMIGSYVFCRLVFWIIFYQCICNLMNFYSFIYNYMYFFSP